MFQRKQVSVFRASRRSILQSTGAAVLAAVTGSATSGARHVLAQGATPEATPVPAAPSAVAVYPAGGTRTASPSTNISFRNVASESLGVVRVTGSDSGLHSGYLVPHRDRNGASFLVDADFHAGETVTVQADVPIGPAEDGSLTFEVSRPAPATAPRVINPDEPLEAELYSYVSRPDIRVPRIQTTVGSGELAPGYLCLGARVQNGPATGVLVDNDGELVWAYMPEIADYQVLDFRVQEYQGRPVLTWFEGASPPGYGYGHFVIFDSAYQRLATVQIGNGFYGGDIHEFLLTPQGTALVGAYQPIVWDLSAVGGATDGVAHDGVIQEIDVETGMVYFEWHSLDHVAIEETHRQPQEDDAAFDYFHFNSIEKDPAGNFIISARHTDAIYKVDGRTGEVIWRLNGNRSDFEMGEGTAFRFQHDARVHPDGTLTLFDNATEERDSGIVSRGLVLELDETAMTATLVREYLHPDEPTSTSQGNMQVLPNGNHLVGWGSEPLLTEFSADGEVVFDGRMDPGANSYRAYRFPWVGRPTDPPAIAVETDGPGAMTIFASWNGATDVAAWRILAGDTPEELAEIGRADRTGFETAIEAGTDAAYVAVEALNSAGAVIGMSEAIRPSR